MAKARAVPRPFEMHWGKGRIVEEAACATPYHEPALQLLQYEDGSLAVRFCYFDHTGRFQRAPLMVSERAVADLRAALAKTPRLRRILKRLVG